MAIRKSNLSKTSNTIACKKTEDHKHNRNGCQHQPVDEFSEALARDVEEFDRNPEELFARWEAETESLSPMTDMEEFERNLDPDTRKILKAMDKVFDEWEATMNKEIEGRRRTMDKERMRAREGKRQRTERQRTVRDFSKWLQVPEL